MAYPGLKVALDHANWLLGQAEPTETERVCVVLAEAYSDQYRTIRQLQQEKADLELRLKGTESALSRVVQVLAEAEELEIGGLDKE